MDQLRRPAPPDFSIVDGFSLAQPCRRIVRRLIEAGHDSLLSTAGTGWRRRQREHRALLPLEVTIPECGLGVAGLYGTMVSIVTPVHRLILFDIGVRHSVRRLRKSLGSCVRFMRCSLVDSGHGKAFVSFSFDFDCIILVGRVL